MEGAQLGKGKLGCEISRVKFPVQGAKLRPRELAEQVRLRKAKLADKLFQFGRRDCARADEARNLANPARGFVRSEGGRKLKVVSFAWGNRQEGQEK